MIEFAAELYSEQLITEMMPLWRDHHKEIPQVREASVNPNLEMYKILASAHVLRIYTARRDFTIVGYQVFTVTIHPHFRELKQAVMDLLYLSPDERLGWMGYMFMKFVDEELKKEGVHLMFRAISARHDFGTILERMGYQLCDLNFSRRIN